MKNKKPVVSVETATKSIEAIKEFIRSTYKPGLHPLHAHFHLTTNEVHERLQVPYPGDYYTNSDVALWLNELGFKLYDFGTMNNEWLIDTIEQNNTMPVYHDGH